MPRLIRPIVPLILALAACDMPTESVTPVPGELSVQRQVWEQQGIDDYRFVLGRTCMCEPLPIVHVDVRDGRVVAVREVKSGRAVPGEEWQDILTVDGVFAVIERAQARGETPQVAYHPTLGYPMAVMIGTFEFDGGFGYQLRGLVRAE